METLALRIAPADVELRDEPSPTGFVHIEHGGSRAVLLTPDEIDPGRSYTLITVLHGAGRQDEQRDVRDSRPENEGREGVAQAQQCLRSGPCPQHRLQQG